MPDNLEIVANYLANSRPPVNASVAENAAFVSAWNNLAAEVKELRLRPKPPVEKAKKA